MANKVKYGLMIFALVIMLGHQFTPHTHSSSIKKDNFLFDTPVSKGNIFKNLFHLDLGQDHLEKYKVFSFVILFLVVSVGLLNYVRRTKTKALFIPLQIRVCQACIRSSRSFRAPPF